uniref:Uncharacterized protein n=1 Tax=Theileria annulata TaxID=5874 RepID=A0A3B0MME6_THEAN
MSKFDSPSEKAGVPQSATFSSESCLGKYTQMRDRLKKLLSPKNSDDLYELLLLLKNSHLFGSETVTKIDTLFSEIAICTPEDDLTHVELADCFVSTLLSYIDDEYFIELLQNIILHTRNNSLILSCENRLFELVFVLGMDVTVDKLRNPLGLVYVILKSSVSFNSKFVSNRVSQDESRINVGYLLTSQIYNSMLSPSSPYAYNFNSNFEQNEVYSYISSLKLDNRNLKEFLNKECFGKICEQIVYYCGDFANSVKFLENLVKICKFIHSKDVSGSKNYRSLTVSILTQRFTNPIFQADLILTFLENMYHELLSQDFKDFYHFSINFPSTFGFNLKNPFNEQFNDKSSTEGQSQSDHESDEYKHDEDSSYDYSEDNMLKSDLFFNLFPAAQEEDLIEVYWILETDILFALFHSMRSSDHSDRFYPLFLSLLKEAKNPSIFSRAIIFKLALVWSDYMNAGRCNYNPISLKIVTMNQDFWFLFQQTLCTIVPKSVLLNEVKQFKDDFKDKRCESLFDFILNIAIHTDSDCFFIVLLELLRCFEYDVDILKYSVQMFQSTLLEFFKHNRVRFSRGLLEIVCFCRQHFDWGFMTMLVHSIDALITGDSDKFAKISLSDAMIDYLSWKLQLETDINRNLLDSDSSILSQLSDAEDQRELSNNGEEPSNQDGELNNEEVSVVRFQISTNIIAEMFYILYHLTGPNEVLLQLFFMYNQHLKSLSSYNILLLPLYRGMDHRIKRGLQLEEHEDQVLEDQTLEEEDKGPDLTVPGLSKLDFMDKTQFALGPNKDIYGYLLLNEDSELTTTHVVTLIFSGKMAKNVLNAVKLLNSEDGARPQQILNLILRKFVNKLQQLFMVNVNDSFCLHMSKPSAEEELLIKNLRILSSFLSGLISLHINSDHIDSIYMIFMTLLECLRSETVFLIEFSFLTFNNIKNLFSYPHFTREFLSDPKVTKFYPNIVKNYKSISSTDSVSEIETNLDDNIANRVVDHMGEDGVDNVEVGLEEFDKCIRDKGGIVIIKEPDLPSAPVSVGGTSGLGTTPSHMPISSVPTPTGPLPSVGFEVLSGICSNMDYNGPKIYPLFYHEQCLMTILNVGIDDFFNTLKLQIDVPENTNDSVNAFTFSGPQFVQTVESLVHMGNLDWLFFLVLRHAVIKGESSFTEITNLLHTLGPKMCDYFVRFLSFSVNLFLKYLRSCRALLVYKKILLVCASLLGHFTVARNKPLLTKHLNLKQLLSFSYEKGMLSIAVPFVCRLMTYVVKSKIFKLPNPWTFCVLSLLNEIKNVKNLKQILVLEISNLIVLLMAPKNQQQTSPIHTSQSTSNLFSLSSGPTKSASMYNLPTGASQSVVQSPANLNSVMKSNMVGGNASIGSHIKELLKHRVLGEFDQSCRFSSNIWSNSNETKLNIPPIHNDIKVLLKRKIIINSKLITTTNLSINNTVAVNNNTGALNNNTIAHNNTGTVNNNNLPINNNNSVMVPKENLQMSQKESGVINLVMSMDLYKLILNAIESCYRESIFIIEKIVPICVSTCGVLSKIDFSTDTSIDTLKRCLTSMTTGLSTSLVNVLCKEVLLSILSYEIYQSLLNHYTQVTSGNLNTVNMGETCPIFDCIWLEYISQILARDNLALVCALVEQLTLELMGRSLDEMISSWPTSSTSSSSISSILYNQFLSTLHTNNNNSGYYVNAANLRNTDDLSLLYKKYLTLVPSSIARVERTEKRPGLRFPDFFIVPPIESIPTNLVICKFEEFEQRLKESAKYLLMYPPIVPMANCKFLYKCESSSLLLLSFLPKNHQIFTLLWSIHYIVVKATNITECYEMILNRVVKNLVDSKAVSIPSLVNEVELTLLEMLCVDNANLVNITTALLPNLTFNKLVLFLRFKLIKIPALDIYLCNSGDLEFVTKMVYRLIVDSNYITLKELPLSLKFLSKFDKNTLIHSVGEPTKLNIILSKLFNQPIPNTGNINNMSSNNTMANNTGMTMDRLISLRLLFMNRVYIRNRCVVQTEVSKKHINMFMEFLNCESDSDVDLFFINFNENPIDHFITSALLLTLFISYQSQQFETVERVEKMDHKRLMKFDGIPRVTYGSPNLEYVPAFCKLVNGFIQTDVFILQKVLHILLSVLYKNCCFPVFFKVIQNFIFNTNYTFSAHVSISHFLLYCNPTEMTSFAPFWVQLATSKQLIQSLIQSPVEWYTLSQLIKYTLIYYTTAISQRTTQKDGKDTVIDTLLDNILNILLYLLQICPEFICGYYLSFCEVTSSVRFRNIFTFSTPKNVKCSNPATATEISETSPLSFVNHIQYIIQKPTLKGLTDTFIAEPSDRLVPMILKELQSEGILIYYTLYLGYTLPLLISKIGLTNANTSPGSDCNPNSVISMRVINCYLLLEKLVVQSKSKLLVSSMLLHARYPNLVTIRFISIFKNLFERAENVQELIITCILERLLVKPHPWGVVHLLFQLVKFKKFWNFIQHNKHFEEQLKKIKTLYMS